MSIVRNLEPEFRNTGNDSYLRHSGSSGGYVGYDPQNAMSMTNNRNANKPPTPQRCEIEVPGRFKIQIQAVGKNLHIKHSGLPTSTPNISYAQLPDSYDDYSAVQQAYPSRYPPHRSQIINKPALLPNYYPNNTEQSSLQYDSGESEYPTSIPIQRRSDNYYHSSPSNSLNRAYNNQSPTNSSRKIYPIEVTRHKLSDFTNPDKQPPIGVRSKILYTAPANYLQGFVSSKPSAALDHSSVEDKVRNWNTSDTINDSDNSDNSFTPIDINSNNCPTEKETEVDNLTNLLMKNISASADPDFYGICAKCGEAVMSEKSGCSALDKIYHLDCFKCSHCDVCLGGQPFYALETKPQCEPCYLDTLEKCSVCSKPITDRILRATGKPYHPHCFVCVICRNNLDGVPFTVDASNKIYCIEDFHKEFAPRCCTCSEPIMPDEGSEETVRIVALDKNYHTKCFRCEDCDLKLSSETEGHGCYPLDDAILCKSCNAKRIQAMSTKMTTEL